MTLCYVITIYLTSLVMQSLLDSGGNVNELQAKLLVGRENLHLQSYGWENLHFVLTICVTQTVDSPNRLVKQ
jgi:hypothetical protein